VVTTAENLAQACQARRAAEVVEGNHFLHLATGCLLQQSRHGPDRAELHIYSPSDGQKFLQQGPSLEQGEGPAATFGRVSGGQKHARLDAEDPLLLQLRLGGQSIQPKFQIAVDLRPETLRGPQSSGRVHRGNNPRGRRKCFSVQNHLKRCIMPR
jgi:hypothetical protein